MGRSIVCSRSGQVAWPCSRTLPGGLGANVTATNIKVARRLRRGRIEPKRTWTRYAPPQRGSAAATMIRYGTGRGSDWRALHRERRPPSTWPGPPAQVVLRAGGGLRIRRASFDCCTRSRRNVVVTEEGEPGARLRPARSSGSRSKAAAVSKETGAGLGSRPELKSSAMAGLTCRRSRRRAMSWNFRSDEAPCGRCSSRRRLSVAVRAADRRPARSLRRPARRPSCLRLGAAAAAAVGHRVLRVELPGQRDASMREIVIVLASR